jgi:hypothetical protein
VRIVAKIAVSADYQEVWQSKWVFGPVAFVSTALTSPIAGYQKQSQFAAGGL